MQKPPDIMMKIVIVGSAAVGKSNIMSRFTRNTFNMDQKSTIGVEFASMEVVIDNKNIGLQIWDTAGQERYKSLTKGFYRNAIGIFLVYDITKMDSFEDAKVEMCSTYKKLLKECRQEACPQAKISLVGNKNDLTNMREVTRQQAKEYASENGLSFWECSAKSGDGLDNGLLQLTSEIYDMLTKETVNMESPMRKQSISIKSVHGEQGYLSRCCYFS